MVASAAEAASEEAAAVSAVVEVEAAASTVAVETSSDHYPWASRLSWLDSVHSCLRKGLGELPVVLAAQAK